MPLIYNLGWGTPIFLHHRNIQSLSTCCCDALGIWTGTTGSYSCIVGNSNVNILPERGEIYIRGHLFSVLRKNRVRVTYRYGGEPGDCWASISVPKDIEDATVKLTAIDLVTSSMRFDILPRSDLGFDLDKAVARWEADADRIIRNREEFHVVVT